MQAVDQNYIYYCPICGHIFWLNYDNVCPKCENYITICRSEHEGKYYDETAKEKYGTATKFKQVLLEEEISKNPLYNPNTDVHNGRDELLRRKHEEWVKDNEERIANSLPGPKCPTCGSHDVKRISDVRRYSHALVFGLFSKTARSQFECNQCHYKW